LPPVATMVDMGDRLDVAASLAEMRLVLGLAAGGRKELVIECDPNLPAVRYDAVELRRTLMELVERAAAAVADCGRIVVRATAGTGRVVVLAVGNDATLYLPVWD
jgi:nitrogen-specific signal transduction histidine kinase